MKKSKSVKRKPQAAQAKNPRENTKHWWIAKKATYGGSMNYRKVERPFDPNKLAHVIFTGRTGIEFSAKAKTIKPVIEDGTSRYGVKVKDLAIKQGEIHMLVGAKEREDFINCLRFLSSEIGRKYKAQMKSQKSGKGKKAKPIWEGRPFSRLVGRDQGSLSLALKELKKNSKDSDFLP